jgi:hypothetical protein
MKNVVSFALTVVTLVIQIGNAISLWRLKRPSSERKNVMESYVVGVTFKQDVLCVMNVSFWLVDKGKLIVSRGKCHMPFKDHEVQLRYMRDYQAKKRLRLKELEAKERGSA